jgi:glutamate N-acetyltransferase / amino-acid N-acetyltransferase
MPPCSASSPPTPLLNKKRSSLPCNEAVARSFNRITVDGDMSTNDTVLVLANRPGRKPEDRNRRDHAGRLQNSGERDRSDAATFFQAALNHVCLELAKMIVRDGEGVSRFVTVRVNGASKSFADADAAARAVANSALVKTSWHGGRSQLGPHHRRPWVQPGDGGGRKGRYWLQRSRAMARCSGA